MLRSGGFICSGADKTCTGSCHRQGFGPIREREVIFSFFRGVQIDSDMVIILFFELRLS